MSRDRGGIEFCVEELKFTCRKRAGGPGGITNPDRQLGLIRVYRSSQTHITRSGYVVSQVPVRIFSIRAG